MQRYIQKKKFYATLPHKIDAAVEQYKDDIKKTAKDQDDLDWQFEETGKFGEKGWTISYSYKPKSEDQAQ